MQILLINTTDGDLIFSNDGVLELFCQAKSAKGDWVDIEGRRMPWNCYGKMLTLNNHSYYKAIVPCYKGTIETDLRYRFAVCDRIFYSDIFAGTVNVGQIEN